MFTDLILFSSSICNLNCTYCYVKKEKAVFDFDQHLVNALKSGEYIRRFKKDFPESVNALDTLEIWGAEPSIHLDLVADKLKDFKSAFPNLNHFIMSSNYTSPNFIPYVKKMLSSMAELPNTQWEYRLQCSIDGLPEINDKNRGIGTTAKIIENINIIKAIEVPQNVHLIINNKGTISKYSFDDFANYDFCVKYYNFFDDLFSYHKKDNKSFYFSAPTCVEPEYYTKDDGLKYNKLIENFIKISKEYNCNYVPYIRTKTCRLSKSICGGLCGQCHSCIIMLPFDKYGVCHRTGLDIVPEHYNARANELQNCFDREIIDAKNWLTDINGYRQLVSNMNVYYGTKSKLMYTQFYNIVKLLRDIGEVSPIYYDEKKLEEHTKLFMDFPICMQTNKDLTGSYFCCSSYFLPLLFNGAIEKIYDYLKEKGKLSGGKGY